MMYISQDLHPSRCQARIFHVMYVGQDLRPSRSQARIRHVTGHDTGPATLMVM